jgi:glycosyltransferase involved in cell wall biosynthesis
MKIAFLSFYSGQINRGVETVAKELAERLSNNNKVVVFQSAPNKSDGSYDVKVIATSIDQSVKDKTTSISRRFFVDYWSIKIAIFTLRTLPLMWQERFDIIVALNGGWQPAFIRLLTWLRGGKLVISGQTGIGWDEKNNLMSFPDCYIGLSSKSTGWARHFNPLIKTTMIPNGVDLQKFSPEGEPYKTNLEKPIVLAVGAFTEQKRLNLAIKAVSKMKNVSLLVVGGGGDLGIGLKEMGKSLLRDRFRLLSAPFADMPKVYRVANIFTLPSASSEAFGNVLVEATATNLPVVATDDPIRREIVGDGGFLVDPTNTEKYAEILQKALDTNWGNKPYKEAEKFSWEAIAEKYEELFKKLLNQN